MQHRETKTVQLNKSKLDEQALTGLHALLEFRLQLLKRYSLAGEMGSHAPPLKQNSVMIFRTARTPD